MSAARGRGRCSPLPALQQVAEGAGSLARALGRPPRGYRRLLPGCLRVSFWSLLSVGACCALLRAASCPFRLLLPESAALARWTDWGTLASAAASFAVYAVQSLLPGLCGPLFLGALELRDRELAEALRGLPAQRSPSRQLLRASARMALAGAGAAVACALAGPAAASLIPPSGCS
ncbi:unnamed protein product [Prorocentrum cordatum]|uniref:Uncharacterized protein n=1 Tax=Prorocentrum cordatum TaxID=2364126 RepID=A0ABN9S7C6_9DINO|nr:unnamed protein product [Polarella glacialis]